MINEQEVLNLYSEGYSVNSIVRHMLCKKIKTSAEIVKKILHKNNVTIRHPRSQFKPAPKTGRFTHLE